MSRARVPPHGLGAGARRARQKRPTNHSPSHTLLDYSRGPARAPGLRIFGRVILKGPRTPRVCPAAMADCMWSALPSISAWFVLNIIIGNLNGWILRGGFDYPVLLLTTVHMIVCWVLAGVSLVSCMHPGQAARPANLASIRKVRMLSLAFCASVACGNIALQYIYVSFAQMVTAAGPLFTIMLMYTMTGKRYSRAAYASMLPMCGGVMMCTAGELNFHWLGFFAVVAATLLRGVKSIIQGRLLTSPEDKFDSLTLLFHMSGCSIAPLGFYVVCCESHALFDPRLYGHGARFRWGLVLSSGVVAFFLNLCNFVVTKKTSAVTLRCLGMSRW